ncbi:MAG: SGNH/GDSL hydrolase family protein, partial [Deltaproteobacteria bacterium]
AESMESTMVRFDVWLKRLLLVGFTTLLGLGAIEIALRLVYPVEPVFLRDDPVYGNFYKPGMKAHWLRETDEPVLVEINSKALRDVERAYEKPPGSVRVLVLGDSMVGGFNVPLEHLLGRRLEHRLRAGGRAPAAEVVSAGIQGFSTGQELLFLRHEGLKYQPDVIVLVFYEGNDFLGNYAETAARSRPSFSLEDGELRLHTPETNAWVLFLRDKVLARSAVAQALRRRLFHRFRALENAATEAGLIITVPHEPRSEKTMQEVARVTNALIAALDRESRAAGARFAVLMLPGGRSMRERLPPEYREGLPPLNPSLEEQNRRMNAALVGFLRGEAIPHVDAVERFLEEVAQGREVYVDVAGHLTSHGHQVVAELLYDLVSPMLDAPGAASERAAPGTPVATDRPAGDNRVEP